MISLAQHTVNMPLKGDTRKDESDELVTPHIVILALKEEVAS